MIKLKNILNEQMVADKGNIRIGPLSYELQADTVIPFYDPKINVKSIKELPNGTISLVYIDPQSSKPTPYTIQDKSMIQKIKTAIKTGLKSIPIKVDIPKVNQLILNKV